MRGGSSCYERIEGLQMTKRFLQLESEHTQLMPKVVRQREWECKQMRKRVWTKLVAEFDRGRFKRCVKGEAT